MLKKWKALSDWYVLLVREGWKKLRWLSVARVAWEKPCYPWWDLIACKFSKHICKILNMKVLLTLEEIANSKPGLRKKNLLFHQYLLLLYRWMDAACLCCGFCCVSLLNLHTFYFWAIIVSRAGHRVGSWRAALPPPSSLSLNFWAWGLAFEQKFCDGDCRD